MFDSSESQAKFIGAGKRPHALADDQESVDNDSKEIEESNYDSASALSKRARNDQVPTEAFLLEQPHQLNQASIQAQLVARQKKGRKVTSQAVSDA